MTTEFDRSIGEISASLGDPTRRGIYVSVRESAEPVTAMEIAESFDIHANVARHHLDRLTEDGYLSVTRRRRTGKTGPGAGRPAKCYQATDKEVAVQFPPRRHELLAELLAQVAERLDSAAAPQVAEEVGREYGRRLAREISFPEGVKHSAAEAVATAMTGVGFGMSAGADGRQLVTSHCPFGQTAAEHPELVCRIDQGIVKGLLEAADHDAAVVVTPHEHAHEACITRL